MEHRHTPDEERRIREAALDETIAESFPASDPPSTLPNPDDDTLMGDGAAPGTIPPPPEHAPAAGDDDDDDVERPSR